MNLVSDKLNCCPWKIKGKIKQGKGGQGGGGDQKNPQQEKPPQGGGGDNKGPQEKGPQGAGASSQQQRPDSRGAPQQQRPDSRGVPQQQRPDSRGAPQQQRPDSRGAPQQQQRPDSRGTPQQQQQEARGGGGGRGRQPQQWREQQPGPPAAWGTQARGSQPMQQQAQQQAQHMQQAHQIFPTQHQAPGMGYPQQQQQMYHPPQQAPPGMGFPQHLPPQQQAPGMGMQQQVPPWQQAAGMGFPPSQQQGPPLGYHPSQQQRSSTGYPPAQQQGPPVGPPPGLVSQQQPREAPSQQQPREAPSQQQPTEAPPTQQVKDTGDTTQKTEKKPKSRGRKGKGQQQQGGAPEGMPGQPQQQAAPSQQQAAPSQQQAALPQQQKDQHQQQGTQPQQRVQPQQSAVRGDVATGSQGAGTVVKQVGRMNIGGSEGDIKDMEWIAAKPGIKGRKIPIETNHLRLDLGKLKSAIHYDVALTPDTPKKFLRGVMELCRQKYYPNRYPAYDGRKNLFSSNMLPFGTNMSGEVTYRDKDGREKQYRVEIKFAKEVDLRTLQQYELSRATPRDALQVVDIVLRSAPAASLISVGQSFFVKPPEIIDLGEGMEMYHGFYQSAIRGWKPFLNVDVAHKAFPKNMAVVDALIDVLSTGFSRFNRDDLSRPLDRRDVATFEKFIKTLKVVYEIPGVPSSRRAYRVNGLTEPAGKKTFKLDNGQQMTIQQYFENQKRYRLKYPTLPTLWVGDKQRPNPILLPMELCILEEGQVLNRKMTENQTSRMIRHAATNTEVRKNKIQTGVRRSNYNTHPTVREFGFSVSDQFEKLDARVLTPPRLEYDNKRTVDPDRGVWRGAKFFIGATINKWTIVTADRRPLRSDDGDRLENELYRQAGPNGLIMNSRADKPFNAIGFNLPEIKKYFQTQIGKYDVIFVVVPNSGPQYSYVKTAAEINSGCLTQCIKMRTLSKMNAQTATNILLKVNAKLNGTNHHLQTRPLIMNRPTMIIGADVTHPSPDARDIPSVAAVTASHDPKAFRYNICWRLQPPKQELIDDLENITLEHLHYFYKANNGRKPERIIVFRDGVSEGYFEEIRRAEIRAIRSACKKIQASDYEPSITFLVVQKRHHTRMFPLNPRDSEDKNKNVPAGTCVDTQITHPFMQDFYLVSHASIQGVAKPTKYCTLWDDNNLSNDDIEELTYFLCHMFTRCNRSVSYPAPTYYAHLAAARAKVYIENDKLDLDNLNREYQKYQIQDVIRKDKPMFFV